MSGRDSSYKQPGQTIVTVPIDPALHKRLRIYAATEGRTIKRIVTDLIAKFLDEVQP